MIPIVAPINRDSHKPDITNLQEALLLLLEKRLLSVSPEEQQSLAAQLRQEQTEERYDDGTQRLVLRFQQQHQLGTDGFVDEATARALNQLLQQLGAFTDNPKNDGWVVRGQVVDASGPLNGIQVTVFDRDLFFRRGGENTGQQLGNGTTKNLPAKNEDGWFEFAYATTDFATGDVPPTEGDPTPDLVFALSRDG